MREQGGGMDDSAKSVTSRLALPDAGGAPRHRPCWNHHRRLGRSGFYDSPPSVSQRPRGSFSAGGCSQFTLSEPPTQQLPTVIPVSQLHPANKFCWVSNISFSPPSVTTWPMTSEEVKAMSQMSCSVFPHPALPRHGACAGKWEH